MEVPGHGALVETEELPDFCHGVGHKALVPKDMSWPGQ